MGYFANITEGDVYEQRVCACCLHYSGQTNCPDLSIHMLTGYAECDNEKSVLHKMIPMDADGHNQQCVFFEKVVT